MDLNVMLREQARSGLQSKIEAAVTNGDIEAVNKLTVELEKLAVATAPKSAPYTPADIQTELEKLDWYGIDPKKSARVVELGKSMSLKKFGTAAEFAAAVVKAVDEEFKKPPAAGEGNDEIEEPEDDEIEEPGKVTPKKPRASDGPSDGDATGGRARRSAGPWTKMSDAPADIQKEINRTADKWAPKTKEGHQKYVDAALASHYTAAQRNKAKK